MAIPITQDDLEARIGLGEVVRFSRGTNNVPNADNVARAIAQAWDSFRDAAANLYTPESIDALTAETLPDVALLHISGHACAILASGSNFPENIKEMNDAAARWRGYIVGDTVRSFDGILTRIDSEGGVTYKAPDRKFNRAVNDYWGIPRRAS